MADTHTTPKTIHLGRDLPRRRLTVVEMVKMVEAGILGEKERVELINGEMIMMSPKGIFHEVLKTRLNMYWAQKASGKIELAPETTFHLDEHSYLEPDFIFYMRKDGLRNLNGETALLAVEVADSSLSYDLGRKREVYCSFGIRELWVIDAKKLITHIFLEPGEDGYATHHIRQQDEQLVPTLAPEFFITLGELDLD